MMVSLQKHIQTQEMRKTINGIEWRNQFVCVCVGKCGENEMNVFFCIFFCSGFFFLIENKRTSNQNFQMGLYVWL